MIAVRQKMKGTVAQAAASLPDDVVREILVRMDDVTDLFRCAMTCKQWRRIVSKASFLRRSCWPDHDTASFLPGFFLWEKIVIKDDHTFVTRFVPTPGSVFGSDRRSLESFFPRAATSGTGGHKRGLLHNAVPLVTRHGLLLVRLDAPTGKGKGCLVSSVRLAVCNLLSGACDKLPLLECDWDFDKSGYAILTSADCTRNDEQQPLLPLLECDTDFDTSGYAILISADCTRNDEQQPLVPSGYSSFFKVLVIGTDMHYRPHNLHTFTSGTPAPLYGVASLLVHYFTMHDPILHTIEVDAGTFNISLTKIDTSGELIRAPKYKPHNYGEPQHTLLTVDVDGQLSFLHVQRRGSQLERWTRHGDAAPIRWLRTQVIELNPPSKSFMLTLLEEKGGMLFVKDDSGNMYTIDLETGAMKRFTNFGTIKRRQLVPHEMDWPAFFISRLGAHEPHSKKPSS
uniref:Uncharacterized protein n=1 Tax=Aegilops tauschii TaxID=37682 RepID=M8AV66_AEGTA